jgi:hypothetical protein
MAFFFGKPMTIPDYNLQADALKIKITESRGINKQLRDYIQNLIVNGTNKNSVDELLQRFKDFTKELVGIRNSIRATQNRFKYDISRIKQPIKNATFQQYLKRSYFSNKYVVHTMPPINKMQSILDTVRPKKQCR